MINETNPHKRLQARIQECGEEIVESLIEIVLSERTKDAIKIQAAQILLDRGYGRATQTLNLETNQGSFMELLREIEETHGKKKEVLEKVEVLNQPDLFIAGTVQA